MFLWAYPPYHDSVVRLWEVKEDTGLRNFIERLKLHVVLEHLFVITWSLVCLCPEIRFSGLGVQRQIKNSNMDEND